MDELLKATAADLTQLKYAVDTFYFNEHVYGGIKMKTHNGSGQNGQ